VIESWLQITCDKCGETENATFSDYTITEFREELGQHFVRYKKQDLCKFCFKMTKAKDEARGTTKSKKNPFTGCTCPKGRYDNNCIVHGGDEG
jgi:hypothetical protein